MTVKSFLPKGPANTVVDCSTGVLECSAGRCRAVQGGAGQGVHMPKLKFSIKTEILGGGGCSG